MTKRILKSIKKTEEKRLVNFKATDDQIIEIENKAKEYTMDKNSNWNMSEWIREAAMNYVPPAKDLIAQ